MWTVIATITGIATLLYMIRRDKKSNNEKRQQEVKERRNRMANPGSPADHLAVLEEESPSVFAPELKVPRKPKDLVSRIEEEGRCFFRWGGKEYDIDKSTLVYGDKDGIKKWTPMLGQFFRFLKCIPTISKPLLIIHEADHSKPGPA